MNFHQSRTPRDFGSWLVTSSCHVWNCRISICPYVNYWKPSDKFTQWVSHKTKFLISYWWGTKSPATIGLTTRQPEACRQIRSFGIFIIFYFFLPHLHSYSNYAKCSKFRTSRIILRQIFAPLGSHSSTRMNSTYPELTVLDYNPRLFFLFPLCVHSTSEITWNVIQYCAYKQ